MGRTFRSDQPPTPGAGDGAELAAIMARIADGDDAACWTLHERFGHRISAVMRRHVAAMGVVHIGADDLAGLTAEACMTIADVAGSWSPEGGATPWHYARGRLVQLARVHVGQHADELDDVTAGIHDHRVSLRAVPDPPGDEPGVADLLARIVETHERAALLNAAFDAVGASARDRHLLIEHGWQEAEGDRSPATTLAGQYGMSEVAVRKAVSRLRGKIRSLLDADESWSPLAELPLVA